MRVPEFQTIFSQVRKRRKPLLRKSKRIYDEHDKASVSSFIFINNFFLKRGQSLKKGTSFPTALGSV